MRSTSTELAPAGWLVRMGAPVARIVVASGLFIAQCIQRRGKWTMCSTTRPRQDLQPGRALKRGSIAIG